MCAGIIVGKVMGNSISVARPPIVTANKFIGCSPSRVSSGRVIMMCINNFPMEELIV